MTPTQTERLRRRNALWQQLRAGTPGTPAFEEALTALSLLTGWDRPRLLAGLGLTAAEVPPGRP
ncbi:hypothetical protein [Deinococcus kurensis]|uniref:hypothetical protein n=1 Tax=Deinococcus kurensis TaxID=2662757 RepID=UPI0012D318BE|nr:hypothetical protein [Deinococcus kurensis]